jgi:hypothetical protein
MGLLGDPGDTPHVIPGNPDKSMLGGEGSPSLGNFSVPGNPDPGAVMPGDPGWPGDSPEFCSPGNPDAAAVKSMFRGGSDALTMDGRVGGG